MLLPSRRRPQSRSRRSGFPRGDAPDRHVSVAPFFRCRGPGESIAARRPERLCMPCCRPRARSRASTGAYHGSGSTRSAGRVHDEEPTRGGAHDAGRDRRGLRAVRSWAPHSRVRRHPALRGPHDHRRDDVLDRRQLPHRQPDAGFEPAGLAAGDPIRRVQRRHPHPAVDALDERGSDAVAAQRRGIAGAPLSGRPAPDARLLGRAPLPAVGDSARRRALRGALVAAEPPRAPVHARLVPSDGRLASNRVARRIARRPRPREFLVVAAAHAADRLRPRRMHGSPGGRPPDRDGAAADPRSPDRSRRTLHRRDAVELPAVVPSPGRRDPHRDHRPCARRAVEGADHRSRRDRRHRCGRGRRRPVGGPRGPRGAQLDALPRASTRERGADGCRAAVRRTPPGRPRRWPAGQLERE